MYVNTLSSMISQIATIKITFCSGYKERQIQRLLKWFSLRHTLYSHLHQTTNLTISRMPCQVCGGKSFVHLSGFTLYEKGHCLGYCIWGLYVILWLCFIQYYMCKVMFCIFHVALPNSCNKLVRKRPGSSLKYDRQKEETGVGRLDQNGLLISICLAKLYCKTP